jgi:signal transduction histidine kinase
MRSERVPSMLRGATSLRGKITAGYVLGFLLLVAFSSILFATLLVVEERIGSYSGISRFLDTTLEMRRYEKNYLLYGRAEDLDAAIAYADAAIVLVGGDGLGGGAGVSRFPAWLRFMADVERETKLLGFRREETIRLLKAYVALLRDARAGNRPPEPSVNAIRERGREVTQIAERLSSVEGENIQEIVRSGRRKLVVLVLLFLLGTAFFARVVARTALRPLKDLETGMQRIASGELRMLPVGPARDEIGSMHAAFNRMIGEIFEHREELMRSDKLASLGTMLAGIAHELNNPLSNISTSAELLEEENERLGPAQRRELVGQIVSETDRATQIIRTVLDYSREPHPERRPTNLLSALFESVILVRGELPTHVSVNLDVAPDIEVLAHKTKLQQAFINLMTNAIDAMREAHRDGTIDVSARFAAGDEQVEIVFRDTGAGIPPNVVDRVFDPFFSTKDVGHGTGLGLYLTHQIVEQHGGTIRVESAVGEGTTVTIRLPRIAPAAASGEARAQEGG